MLFAVGFLKCFLIVAKRCHYHFSTLSLNSFPYLDIVVAQEDQIIHINQVKSERAMMKILSGQNKDVIDREMAGFFEQRKRLMHEMTKWDETANDIVILAKKMCVIMMEMTDFTRGKGSLKTTMDVIEVK